MSIVFQGLTSPTFSEENPLYYITRSSKHWTLLPGLVAAKSGPRLLYRALSEPGAIWQHVIGNVQPLVLPVVQDVINSSWAAPDERLPYHIYLKIAYHLAEEARCGLSEFRISPDFGNRLFEFQKAAVKIAAHHLNKRDGVLIGDVVGLGKTLMATAVARVFQDDYSWETLIICPKNLTKMWQSYVDQYRLIAKVLPSSRLLSELPNLRRYRLVVVDESHNFRNLAGK